MSGKFPTMNQAKRKGQSGQTYIEHYITEQFGWIYHDIPTENDYGIDAYLEIVENTNVSGKLIGIQIKHGDSFFKNKTEGGFKYKGEDKHLNYYLNSEQPIIIIILDDLFKKKKWILFDIEKTMPLKNGWWVEIPDRNNFDKNCVNIWKKYVSPIVDYKEIIERNWKIDHILQNSVFRLVSVSKQEILSMNFDLIKNFFKRISKNHAQMLKSRSSLDIYFPEYDDDPREIYDIPEIRKWIKGSIEQFIPWVYYIDFKRENAAFFLLIHAYSREKRRIKKNTGFLIELNKDDILNFLEYMFKNLNAFTEENNIPLKINKEISEKLIEYFDKQLLGENGEHIFK